MNNSPEYDAGKRAEAYALRTSDTRDDAFALLLDLCYELGLKPDPFAKEWQNPRTISRQKKRERERDE